MGAEIKLAWDSNSEPDLAGYRVYYGLSTGNYTEVIDIGMGRALPDNSTGYTLEGLVHGQSYFIAVTAYDSSGNESGYSNEVSGIAQGVVEVLAPLQYEVIPSGSLYTIQWWATSEAARFKISCSLDGGAEWKRIAEDLTNTTYTWSVPTPSKNKKNYRFKITAYDSSGKKLGKSVVPFAIEVVRLLSPNGGDVFYSGESRLLTWQTHATKNPVAKVKLYYTKNGGITWSLIESLDGNPEIYTWQVPLVEKTKTRCRVKIVLKDAEGNTVGADSSDEPFTIQP